MSVNTTISDGPISITVSDTDGDITTDTRTNFWKDITISDIVNGIAYGLWYSLSHIYHSYILILIGVLVLFVILYGINQLLTNVIHFKFPASVLMMLVNLILLVVLNSLSTLPNKNDNEHIKRISYGSSWLLTQYLTLTKPCMNFSLKWINVYFIPSFVTLPLSQPITFVECMKIAGVFVIGFLALFFFDVYFVWGLRIILDHFGWHKDDTKMHLATSGETDFDDQEASIGSGDEDNEIIELQTFNTNSQSLLSHMRDDITTIDIQSLRSTGINRDTSDSTTNSKPRTLSIHENPFVTEGADIIPEPQPAHQKLPHDGSTSTFHKPTPSQLSLPSLAQSATEEDIVNEPLESESDKESTLAAHLSKKSQIIVLFITEYFDWLFYGLMFICSLPFYFIPSIHLFLPYHLSITVLSFYIALSIPQKWPSTRRFAHPILISTFLILLFCFIGSLIYHQGKLQGFLLDLEYYRTGRTYLNLFSSELMYNNGQTDLMPPHDETLLYKWPGCGDVLASLLDISIVSLSLPMFTHRRDFIKNFWVLMTPCMASMSLSFFVYPIVCHRIGIEPTRSIGFIGRSITLALGQPLMLALGGSVSLMAVCTILSGICGVLVGDYLFKLTRVAKNDYVTRGVTLGINCGAIATAHLLTVDPRAASMSSLSFSVFGTVMVILSSIDAVVNVIRSMVGL
ncbi:LrgB-like family-domain-containing protein [Scheffersomyces amazonensis]|uniref:LrgB-like family-domain-containing protein n=1 Tax=Scheffersomyces amazonensis TaxID=1078765 RepID=UPI00315D30DF